MTARISKCGYCGGTQFTQWHSKSAPRDQHGRIDRDYLDSEPVAYCSEEHRDAADELADAVAREGALPVPVGPEPSERDRLRAAYIEGLDNAHQTHPCPEYGHPYWTGCVHYDEAGRVSGVGSCHNERRADAVLAVRDAELESLRARVAELEAERAKYVGKEPTIAEEMAYLSRCIDSVLDLCSEAERKGITSGGPFTVEAVRRAADGLVERRAYPPALPWARLMDAEDLADFLDELAASAVTYDNGQALAEVEKTCGTWRAIAEAQHAHNTAPGPDAARQSFAERASRETDSGRRVAWRMLAQEMPDGEFHEALHHTYEVGHDLPETGGEHSC